MRKLFGLSLAIFLYSVLIAGVVLAQVPNQPVDPEWLKYADIAVPGVIYLFKALIWVIVVMGTLLINIMIYFGKKRLAKLNSMNEKLDVVFKIVTACEGCNESLGKVAQGEHLLHSHHRKTDGA
jgi:hypothetical protein